MDELQLARGSLDAGGGWLARLLLRALDEIDYGVLLMQRSRVLHLNRAARQALDASHPLQLLGDEVRALHPSDIALLGTLLRDAARGRRRMLTLGLGRRAVSIAAVPLQAAADGDGAGASEVCTLLVLGKRDVCEPLSVQWFALAHGLTPAESRVLGGLCEGHAPRDVADAQHVGLATVRSQIAAIRSKTGAENLRELVRQVAVLPPMRGLELAGCGA